eukprot:827970-Alexandrium_andersonii.AAC.1
MAGRSTIKPEAPCEGSASFLMASASPASVRTSYTGMHAVVVCLLSALVAKMNRRCPTHLSTMLSDAQSARNLLGSPLFGT